jgi:hypothetical protein
MQKHYMKKYNADITESNHGPGRGFSTFGKTHSRPVNSDHLQQKLNKTIFHKNINANNASSDINELNHHPVEINFSNCIDSADITKIINNEINPSHDINNYEINNISLNFNQDFQFNRKSSLNFSEEKEIDKWEEGICIITDIVQKCNQSNIIVHDNSNDNSI